MDQMAAALDRPVVAQPAVANSTSAATDSATPQAATAAAAPTSAAPPATADPSLRTKRGFGLTDWSNEAVYVLVKADAAKTADALARVWSGKVLKDALNKPTTDEFNEVVVYQLAGHPWSIFACHGTQIEPLSTALSSDADVLIIWNSDFNGWSGVDLFRGGKEIEALHWGPEGDGIGEDADSTKWHATGQRITSNEGATYSDVFQFRSTVRKATPQDLNQGEEFVDAMLRHYDAYLPEADQMPWPDIDANTFNSPLPPTAFAGVHAVQVADR